MRGHAKARTAIILAVFTVVFVSLTVGSYTQKSATDDEPVHLAMGYTALKLHDFRIHPETPPFLRMWAALPLLAMEGVRLDTNTESWVQADKWAFSHEFLYEQNDADHLLYPARFMIVLLGVLLGIMLFCWAKELFGFVTATVVLGLYALEPNILAHSSLVTTDLGVTCFIFGTLYFLWRSTKLLTLGNLLGLCLFFALAQISKTTALLLIPLIVVLLGVHTAQRSAWPWRIGRSREMIGVARKTLVTTMIVFVLVLVGYAAIWAVYGFRYGPTVSGSFVFRVDKDPLAREQHPQLSRAVGWLDEHRILPNAYTQGFLIEQARSHESPVYFAGKFRQERLWYYFFAAFLVKTPLVLILLFLAGLALCIRCRAALLSNYLFLLLPVALGFLASMYATWNVGLRHILAVYPFVFLLAGLTVSTFFRHFPRTLAIVCAVYRGRVDLSKLSRVLQLDCGWPTPRPQGSRGLEYRLGTGPETAESMDGSQRRQAHQPELFRHG